MEIIKEQYLQLKNNIADLHLKVFTLSRRLTLGNEAFDSEDDQIEFFERWERVQSLLDYFELLETSSSLDLSDFRLADDHQLALNKIKEFVDNFYSNSVRHTRQISPRANQRIVYEGDAESTKNGLQVKMAEESRCSSRERVDSRKPSSVPKSSCLGKIKVRNRDILASTQVKNNQSLTIVRPTEEQTESSVPTLSMMQVQLPCHDCTNSAHSPFHCHKVSVTGKRKLAYKKGHCFVCLKIGHTALKCKLKYQCVKCKGRHHVRLCDKPSVFKDLSSVPSTTTSGGSMMSDLSDSSDNLSGLTTFDLDLFEAMIQTEA